MRINKNFRQTRLRLLPNNSVHRRTRNDPHSVFLLPCIQTRGVVASMIGDGSLNRTENILEPEDSETAPADCRGLNIQPFGKHNRSTPAGWLYPVLVNAAKIPVLLWRIVPSLFAGILFSRNVNKSGILRCG